MTEAYKEIDPNMIIETKLDAPDIRFHDIRKPPFNVHGLYDYQNQPFFRRMPEDVAAKVSPGVARLERECTGGRVRFTTDSQYVAIHVDYINVGRSSHLTLASSAGFDLFPGGKLAPGKYDMTTACSCPDYANPCKHVAAVLLVLGEEIARRPITLLELRGIEEEELYEV